MASQRTRRERAIVLKKTKLSEQDLILTLLVLSGEQLQVVAKGARKPGSRLAARTELFSETDFLVSAGRGPLGTVSEASIINPHASLRGDLDRVSAASVIIEIARMTCSEKSEDSFLYPICARALRACEELHDRSHLDLVVAAYVLKVMSHGGWRPELDACIACGDKERGYFSVRAGGVICSSCVRDVQDAEPVGSAALAWLMYLIGATFDDLIAIEVSKQDANWLLRIAYSWAVTHLETRLQSFEFYLGV